MKVTSSNIAFRLLLIAGVLLACHFVIQRVKAGYTFTIRQPSVEINELPVVLGNWRGVDQPMDEHMEQFIGASSQVNRAYENSDGEKISIHAAVWTDEKHLSGVAPHHPLVCYPNAGWTILDRENLTISAANGEFSICLVHMERSGQRIATAHWYQLGPHRFTTVAEGRDAQKAYWGQRECPPVVKVLLQTSKIDPQKEYFDLRAFASEVANWTTVFD